MAIQIKGDGSFSIEYEGPFGGLNVEAPETLIPDKDSPAFNNFMLRNKELRSRPQFIVQSPVLQGAAEVPLPGVTSFIDINGKFHTVTWSDLTMYQYDPTLLPAPPWRSIGPAGTTSIGINPLSYRTFANKIYYATVQSLGGSIKPCLAYWDGITANPVITQTFGDGSTSFSIAGISRTDSPTVGGGLPGGPTVVGPLAIGGRYLGELNNQLILANVSVMDQGSGGAVFNFPNMIWWSANGLPLQWDPTQNTSAGFNPFLDVPDIITGMATLGIAGYIFRTDGVTQFAPTGSAVTPFEFDHMWASDHGIGNVFPWSIAQYGPTCAFIAQDNIYSLSVTNAQPIGGNARDAIFADLANASTIPVAGIMPQFKNGYVYLTYQLAITLSTFIRFYVYSFEDKNWAAWDVPFVGDLLSISAPPNFV